LSIDPFTSRKTYPDRHSDATQVSSLEKKEKFPGKWTNLTMTHKYERLAAVAFILSLLNMLKVKWATMATLVSKESLEK